MDRNPKTHRVIKKEKVSDDNFQGLVNYLSMCPIPDTNFAAHVRNNLTAWYTKGYPVLLRMGSVMTRCWFINQGFILAFYEDPNGVFSVYAIFSAGQIAILDESFHDQVPSFCSFMAYPDTHFLEIRETSMREIYKLFPAANELARKILTFQSITKEVVDFARLNSKDKIKLFFKRYAHLRRPNKSLRIMAQHIASYLGMTKHTFSRLLKEIEEEDL